MGKRRMVIKNIWQISSDVNKVIWDRWDDSTIEEISFFNRASTYNIVWSVWRDGLGRSNLPLFLSIPFK